MTVRELIAAVGERLSARAAGTLEAAESQDERAGRLKQAVGALRTDINAVLLALRPGQGAVLRALAREREEEWLQQQREASRDIVDPAMREATDLLEATAPARVLDHDSMQRSTPLIQGAKRLASESPRDATEELGRLEEAPSSMSRQLEELGAKVLERVGEIRDTYGGGSVESASGRSAVRVHEFAKLQGVRTKDVTKVLRNLEPGRKWVGFTMVDPLLQLEVQWELSRVEEP